MKDGKASLVKQRIVYFFVGIVIGVVLAGLVGIFLYRYQAVAEKVFSHLAEIKMPSWPKIKPGAETRQVEENFQQPVAAEDGKSFGQENQLTFELNRGGTFKIDGTSQSAWQLSGHYSDVALIRSSHPLPKTYQIKVTIGEIDYSLDKIANLNNDPNYPEGPKNENGAYLISIVDQLPSEPHTNIWWHQHRKLVIDVDNNVWGHGSPNPIFAAYFNKGNTLRSWDEKEKGWTKEWKAAVHYDPASWYTIELKKTLNDFKFRISDDQGKLLQSGQVPLSEIWHEDDFHPDYFVIGDPHENYYQGSLKIKSISISVEKKNDQ